MAKAERYGDVREVWLNVVQIVTEGGGRTGGGIFKL